MATITKLVAGASLGVTVLSTELNSLANGAASALGATYNQDTNLDAMATAELNVTFGTNPTVSSTVELWMVPAVDGTNFGDWTSGASYRTSGATLCGLFELDAVTSAQRKPLKGAFPLPSVDVKFAVVNRSGVAFPASGSTVKLTTWNYQSDDAA